jgi:DNA-binding NarL/FixJ family response regulator
MLPSRAALQLERSSSPDPGADSFGCQCQPDYPVHIVAVEQHHIFREGLRQVLVSQAGFVVVATAGSGDEAVELAERLRPDILLLDVAIRNGSALDVLQQLAARHASPRTILLSDVAHSPEIVDAVRLGARGLVLKDSPPAHLCKCIGCVAAGQLWFSREQIPAMIEGLRRPAARPLLPAETLTPREIDVIIAVADGATNRAIAEQLRLSDQTVKNHLSHIYDKVGVSNRLELALYAIHHKLTERRR